MPEDRQRLEPILSDFADDAEMSKLIQLFVSELPTRIAELEEAWRDTDIDGLQRVAHQLKGASAGYGFEEIGAAAAALESTVKTADSDLATAAEEFRQLVELCNRAAA